MKIEVKNGIVFAVPENTDELRSLLRDSIRSTPSNGVRVIRKYKRRCRVCRAQLKNVRGLKRHMSLRHAVTM